MKKNTTVDFIRLSLAPFALVFLLWVVYWIEIRWNVNFNEWGLYPRTAKGLVGIVCSPFIHANVEHLYNNSLSLIVLLVALFYFYRPIRYSVLFWGLLGSGLLTWGIGREAYHIGASGIVYMLTSFLFFKGIWSKNYRLIALSLIVVFLYGSMVWGIFPQKENISWEGHLSGLVTGIMLAFFFKGSYIPLQKYAWEKEDYKEEEDPFLKQFDENGNFISASELEEKEATTPSPTISCTENVEVKYIHNEEK